MCGIFGFVGHLDQELAEKCLARLKHRGPDGQGLVVLEDVTLGHTRLAILDLSDSARQPMCSRNGRYWVSFNGEIYNFCEIRIELEKHGYIFLSDSDTEVLLYAWEQWGQSCLNQLNGMWAFAIWDAKEKTLFLSRDRLGKKPLFYTNLPGKGFAFASEMKALFPLLGSIRANVQLVRDSARIFTYESTEECVIEGIKRFPAASVGVLKGGDLRLHRWWCTLDHLRTIPHRYEDQVELFHELFLDAVKLRMRSDVPIGTALSGGLDSSATIAAAAISSQNDSSERSRFSRDWQHAFVASFPQTHIDESEFAQAVASHLNIPLTEIHINPAQEIEKLDWYHYLFEDLYITSPIPFILTYAAIKKSGVSVTLDGHGADELFGGYPNDFLFALLDARWSIGQAFQIVETCYNSSPFYFKKARFKLPFLFDWHGRRLYRRIFKKSTTPGIRSDQWHDGWKQLDNLSRQLYISTHTTVLPTLLRNYDRYSMAHGVEIRMPFLDHRLLSIAFSLPWESKIGRGFSKAIVRDALSPLLPKEIAYRKDKIGFNSPTTYWMKGELKTFFLDTIASRDFMECNLIDPLRVAEVVRNVINSPDATFSDGERAWTLMAPYFWERAIIRKGNRSWN